MTKEINDKFGKGTGGCDRRQHFQQGKSAEPRRREPTARSARSTCWSATPRRIRITVRSAGISDDQFRKILDNNIVANNWLISMVVPQMIERKDGSIIIVSSIGGLKGSTVLGAYAISKAADMQLARNLACEYGKHNIRVNCIAPGLIKTDFAKALWDNPETLKASTARSPLLRIGVPDEIAGAAVLMGSTAGDFMTGQTIVIDGGATIS